MCFIPTFYHFLSAFRTVVGKNVTLKATSLVKPGQMLLAVGELQKFKRIGNPSKLKCFIFASNCELKNAITNHV
ncbi:MAG: hypothetical protein JO297_19290 [Nitrososphaeraceae archaeon]|nr:hypothetical protein [Nitrososphaeraceae archaeon]